ncbi:MAG: exosortase U [Planctomycetales bacterium]|nr:exosortase U [Planctomycetales bacterium]
MQRSSPQLMRNWDFLTGIVPILAMAPMLLIQAAKLGSQPHMRFFPITVVLLVGWIALVGRGAQGTTRKERRWAAVVSVVIGALLYLYSVVIFSPWLAHFALVVSFAGWALGKFGDKHWATTLAWSAVLLTTLPLPWGWDVGFMHWLQGLAAWCTTRALDALSIPCLQNGGLIETRSLTVITDEICGGVDSLYAFFSLATLMLLCQHRSLLVALKVLFLVPVWVHFHYFLRLFSVLIVQEYWQMNLSTGRDFLLLAIATSLFVLLMTWLSSGFFKKLFEPIPVADAEFGPVFSLFNKAGLWPQPDPFEEVEPDDPDDKRNYLKRKKELEAKQAAIPRFEWETNALNVWLVRVAAVMVAVCAVVPIRSLASQGLGSLRFGVPTVTDAEVEQLANKEALPQTLPGGWVQTNFEATRRLKRSRLGQISLQWGYSKGTRQLMATLDMAFLGWHDPVEDRKLLGWREESTRVSVDDNWPWCEAELENELGGKAYLLYSLFTPDSQAYSNLPAYLRAGLGPNSLASIQDSLSDTAVTYQFQILVESGTELNDAEQKELRDGFLSLREIVKGLPTGSTQVEPTPL